MFRRKKKFDNKRTASYLMLRNMMIHYGKQYGREDLVRQLEHLTLEFKAQTASAQLLDDMHNEFKEKNDVNHRSS